MSERGPDFDELVGADLGPAERERLLRVHELLVTAGPPPELSAGVAHPPAAQAVQLAPRRQRGALLALAAALGVLLFALGLAVGEATDRPGTWEVISMTGTPAAEGASALLEVFDADQAGNWPMELRVSGIPTAAGSRLELWLTLSGEPLALCGSFLVADDGTAVVPMNAPYRLADFDGWVVVEGGSTTPLLTT